MIYSKWVNYPTGWVN